MTHPRRPGFVGRVPAGTFVCAVCEANPGECEHTKERPYEVHLKGMPEVKGRVEKDVLFEIGPVTPKPMRMPSGRIFHAEDNPELSPAEQQEIDTGEIRGDVI